MSGMNIRYVAVLVVVCALCASLWGCSKKNASTSTKTTTQSTAAGELFPEVDRTTLITPSGTGTGLAGTASGATSGAAGSGVSSTNLQIGNTTRLRAGRYNLEGLVRIKSTVSVALENFRYNGSCKGFNLYLTRSNAPSLVVVPFNLFNRRYNDETFTFNFPSGVTINNIDAAAMTCSDKPDPIFVTQLD